MSSHLRVSRSVHFCFECERWIGKGEHYYAQNQIGSDGPCTYKAHERCVAMAAIEGVLGDPDYEQGWTYQAARDGARAVGWKRYRAVVRGQVEITRKKLRPEWHARWMLSPLPRHMRTREWILSALQRQFAGGVHTVCPCRTCGLPSRGGRCAKCWEKLLKFTQASVR